MISTFIAWAAASQQLVQGPGISLSAASLTFDASYPNTPVNKTITVTNTGSEALVISNLTISGANSSDFSVTGCGDAVASGSTCTLTVTFTPSTVGSKAASLSITHNALNSPTTVALSGAAIEPDFYFNSNTLLMHMEGSNGSTTFTDVMGLSTFSRIGNAQISTAQSKFGSSSALIPGTGDAIITTHKESLELGAEDFTIECWVRFNEISTGYQIILTKGYFTSISEQYSPYLLTLDNTSSPSQIRFLAGTATLGWVVNASVKSNPQPNVWYHVAVTRSGNTVRCFADGTLTSTSSLTYALFSSSSAQNLVIGNDGSGPGGSNSLKGYVDEVRITKGVARYTAAFTVPAAPFADEVAQVPLISTSTSNLSVTSTTVGSSTTGNITITNTGSVPLTVSNLAISGTNAADFTVSGCSGAVAAGGTCTLTVTFAPTTSGSKAATLSVASNAYNAATTTIELSSTALAPAISLSTSSLSVTSTNINNTSTGTITVTNTGTAPLTVANLAITGTDAADFTVSGCSSPIAASGTCTLTVTFSPTTAGSKTATLSITHDASGSPSTVALSSTATQPAISLSTSDLSIASTEINSTRTGTITVTNTGTGSLTVANLAITGTNAADFTVSGCSSAIAANSTCTLTVAFAPTTTGSKSATLSITHDAAGSPSTVSLSSTATSVPQFSISSNTLSLSGAAGVATTGNLTITNTGTAPLIISNLSISGTDAADFAVSGCSGSVSAGSTCTLTVTFTPSAIGSKSASLSITHDAAGSPNTVTLSGAVTEPDFYFNNNSLLLHMDGSNGSTTFTDVTGKNTFTALGNAQISTAQSKFGGASAYFDGTGDAIFTSHKTALDFGAGDFTVECWVRFNSLSGSKNAVISKGWGDPATGTGPFMIWANNTSLVFYATSSPGGWDISGGNLIGTVTTNTWYHVAVTRQGSTFRCFLNGTLNTTFTSSLSLLSNPTTDLYIGAANNNTVNLDGYVDDVRLTKGVARYTANFAVPTTPFADAAAQVAVIGTSTSNLAIASTNVGSTNTGIITITNTGTSPLTVSNLAISGTNAADFTVSGCSGSVAAGDTCTLTVTFAPTTSGSKAATLTVTSNAYNAATTTIALTSTATAPAISLSTSSLSVTSTTTGSSNTGTIIVTNTGTAPLTVANLAITGTDAADFTVSGCSSSVAAGDTCTLTVTFAPTTSGGKSATLSITHNASGSPSTVSLSSTALAPAPIISLSSSTLTVANATVGSSTTSNITVTNIGTAPLTVTNLAFSGANAAEFSATGCSSNVAVNETCTIGVTFTPTSSGSKSATLAISHNAAGSPSNVSVSSTALAPAISLSTSSLSVTSTNINNTSTGTITVTNTGTAPLTVSNLAISGTNASDFTVTGCSSSVAAGGTCTLTVTFAPATTGSKSATLSITHDASGSPSAVTLSGTATAPAISLSTSNLSIASTDVNATRSGTITVTNTGTGPLTVANLAISGANASDFTVSGCSSAITANNTCTLTVTFAPTTAGSKSATLSITHDASGSPSTVALSSTATAAPLFSISDSSLSLACVQGTSVTGNLTITNSGAGPLTISSLNITGTDAADFSVSGCGSPVAAGSTCTLTVTFTAATSTSKSATLTITHDAAGSPNTVTLSGAVMEPDFYYDNNSLLLHMDGSNGSTTFTDVTGKNTFTVLGNAQISTAQSKFGGASAYFDGNGDAIYTPHSAYLDFGAGDFTIECWVRFNSLSGSKNVVMTKGWGDPVTGTGAFVIWADNTSLVFYATSSAGIWSIAAGVSFGTVTTNTWYHVAVTRQNSTFRCFLNGALGSTFTSTLALLSNSANALYIGNRNDNAVPLDGYIDEVRLTKGVARYTAAFTAPAAPFANEAAGAALFTWGAAAITDYQTGHGDTVARSSPTLVSALSSSQWKAVRVTANRGMALHTDGTLRAWGVNSYGETSGDDTRVLTQNPTDFFGSSWKWRTAALGEFSTAAIRDDGTLWTWGYNINGQLGHGDRLNRSLKTQVGTDSWVAVATSQRSCQAIRKDGTLWAWGNNSSGELGLNSLINRSSPVQVGTDTWQMVSGGILHFTAIRSDGTLWAWGYNFNGQLGLGDRTYRSSPVQIGTATWAKIASGGQFVLAIQTDGTLWSWGLNNSGQLGQSSTLPRSSPVQIGADTWLEISATSNSGYGLRSDGTLWAWGFNSSGQLGIGNRTAISSPVQVGTDTWRRLGIGNGVASNTVTWMAAIK